MTASRSDKGKRDAGSAPAFAGLVYVQLAAGMIVFGSATPISKIVTEAMPVFVGSLFRVGLGALVLAPAAWICRAEIRQLGRRDWLLVALIALFGMFGFTAFMLYGMRMIPGVTGAIVMATTPAVTAIAAVMFLGEAVTWRKLAALVLAVGGVVLLHATGGAGGEGSAASAGGSFIAPVVLGSVLVFAAVCCEATYTLLGRRMSRQFDPRLVAFLAAALSIPVFVAGSLWQWPDFTPMEVGWAGWSAVIWYGAGTLALGSWLWYAGIAKTEGSIAAGFMALMPVSALVLSYLLLGEEFRVIHLLGFATVFAGVLLMSWEHASASGDA